MNCSLLDRLFSPERLVNPALRRGALPTRQEACGEVLRIAAPSVAEMVLMSLIGSMDTMMIGVLGKTAISAVGLPGQPRMLILCVFFALNVGVTAIVARRKGEGRQEDARRTLRNALMLVLLLSFMLMGVAMALGEPLIRLAGGNENTPEEAQALAGGVIYFKILMASLPVNAAAMCINAAQRGIGNTKLTLYVNVVSNLVNVVFNYLLIGGNLGFPALGVAGAAIASDIGILTGAVLAFMTVLHRKHGREGYLYIGFRGPWRFDKDTMRSIAKVGGNAMLEQLGLRFGFFVYSAIIVGMGQISHAAHMICMQFLNLTFTFGDGIGIAATSLVGQNLGKKRPDLSILYGKIAQRYALIISGVLLLALAALRYPLTALFINTGTADADKVLALAADTLLVVALMQPFQTSAVVLSGCLRGAGDNIYVAVCMTFCVSVVRPIMAVLAVDVFHFSLPLTWLFCLFEIALRFALFYPRFSSGKWTTKTV